MLYGRLRPEGTISACFSNMAHKPTSSAMTLTQAFTKLVREGTMSSECSFSSSLKPKSASVPHSKVRSS